MKNKIDKEFDEEFDWREIQYDGKNYSPTDKVKQFIHEKINERNQEWLNGLRCHNCGAKKENNLSDVCGKCLEEM